MKRVIKARMISKSFLKNQKALDNVSMHVEAGEVLVIMGPSGSGKSTLIRTFNGLESIDDGELEILGINISSENNAKEIKILRKRIGMVFQQFNLFPHLTVTQNITLAQTKVHNKPIKEANIRARDLLLQMGIEDQSLKYPSQLSGGQQQRVAIARALALDPEIMLFDEPTSALDPEKVKEVLDAIKVLARRGMTMVVVTHEITFAREVADRILFMDKGRLIETSTPKEFFTNAKEERSRKFLNQVM
ncbi:amino acid ABC transporter ATP-binding protein [Prochlorococcus sp. MIT 1341]|uniref:amino acid ABC transporter ATP-binding protein n=1 Tax=Prochlorococcus sp. MIT 1341 TaxID=3096221 RepID=UPI002A75FF32|nr:amino acid ABC transporter ATP-binding protein [Prochlorococcus sp. MIT 1341]